MVAHLVLLKWRYVLASLKRSVWAIIGIAFGALYLLGTLTGLGFAYVGLGIDGSLDGPALALFPRVSCISWLGSYPHCLDWPRRHP